LIFFPDSRFVVDAQLVDEQHGLLARGDGAHVGRNLGAAAARRITLAPTPSCTAVVVDPGVEFFPPVVLRHGDDFPASGGKFLTSGATVSFTTVYVNLAKFFSKLLLS
jgi:hypothetical protein